MAHVTGLHHITAISGPPQATVDFYVGVLGLRLVKRSINQDSPDTYHLFFADGDGNPGTDLTFFPWPEMGPGRVGLGVWGEMGFVIPADSVDFWYDRLSAADVGTVSIEERFTERVVVFEDPFGMGIALTGTEIYADQPFSPWAGSMVPAEHQIRALGSARTTVRSVEATEAFLARAFGFRHVATEGRWRRYVVGEGMGGQRIDIAVDPDAPRGSWGVGSIHHVAFRVPTDAAEADVRGQVIAAGGQPTGVIDRFWFKSVYVREPAGALCEIATDGPGFGVDEDMAHLGETLVLPPWYEPQRAAIEGVLPSISIPHAS